MPTPRHLRLVALSVGSIVLTLLAATSPVARSTTAPVVTRDHWGPEELVAPAPPPPYDDGSTLVRTWPTGAAVVTWVDGAHGPVTAARRRPSGRWGEPVTLSSALPAGSSRPDLAVGPHGAASVVWGERTGEGGWRIAESHLDGTAWSVVSTVGASGPRAPRVHAPQPRVVVDGRGTTTIVWSRRGIHSARRAADGDGWKRDEVAARGGSMLQLAANRRGDLVAAWQPHDQGVVAATRRRGRPGWLRAERISPDGVTDLQAGIDRNGRALVVWSVTGLWSEARHDYLNYAAWSRTTSRGGWSPPAVVTDRLGEDGRTDSLVTRPSGAAVLVWYQIYRSDSPFQIWTARMTPDGTWTAPVKVGRCAQEVAAWLAPRDAIAHAIISCRRAVWSSTQAPGRPWSARQKIGDGWLLDADGGGRYLTVIYVHRHELLATALTTAR